MGACAQRSLSACKRSIDVGSNHCKSSRTRTSGWLRAPAIAHSTIAANCLRRISSGERLGKRSGGTGMSTSGASRGACVAGSSLTAARSDSSSASRCSGATSGPPNLARAHPRTGWSGVFCNSCDELHSIHECGLSANWLRNSSTSRDLPMPGSPTIRTNCPAPAKARSEQRARIARSSSRPTKEVRSRAPLRRLPPLIRRMR